MNKKELQERLFALWKLDDYELESLWRQGEESLDINILQKWPNTAVQITYRANPHQHYDGLGFTKVRYPDKWDADYGIGLAVKKALASIARQIVEDEDGE